MNKPTKPFILEYAEAKNKIITAINEAIQEHGVPCVLLESVLSEALQTVKAGALSEKNNVLNAYNKQLADYEKSISEEMQRKDEHDGLGTREEIDRD